MIEADRIDAQSRGGISDVALMEIRSQKKASCGPEITRADEKADLAGRGLYVIGRRPNGDRQFKDTPALGTGHLWWTVEQHLLGAVEDFHAWHRQGFLEGGAPDLPDVPKHMRPGDTLVVWRLSRLARSLKQIIETAHDLEQKKQALKVLTRNIDTGTPEGRLFFHITAAFDEFQRELIVENTKAGLAAARERGRRGRRPRVLDKEKTRVAEAMLKDTVNYPFVGDVIDHLRIGRTAFYRYFPPDRIRELRNQA